MTEAVPDIIERWINEVSIEQPITNITNNGDGTATIETCNTWWALECNNVFIDGTPYEVVSIDRNKSITVKGLPTGGYFTLETPFYIHGVVSQADTERIRLREELTQVNPMIFLFEPIEEDFNEEGLAITREVNVRLAFLNIYREDQFTDDIYNYSIYALRSLAEEFVRVVKNQVTELDKWGVNHRIKSYTKYGRVIDNKGSEKNIFSEKMAGVELFLTLPLKSKNNCLYSCKN